MDEDRLIEALAALEGGIREAHEALAIGLQRAITDPIRETFGAAAEAHRRILDEASFPPGLEERIGDEEGDRDETAKGHRDHALRVLVSVYRARVQSEVLEPLRDALLDRNNASDLESELDAFNRSLIRLAASLPEELKRSEPEDLYLARAGDPLRNQVGKGIVRFRRRMRAWGRSTAQIFRRLGGKSPLEFRVDLQTVPLKELVERSFEGPFTLAIESRREPLHQHFARILGGLETAVARWTREWHPLEGSLQKENRLIPETVEKAVSKRFARLPVFPRGGGERRKGSYRAGTLDPSPCPHPPLARQRCRSPEPSPEGRGGAG